MVARSMRWEWGLPSAVARNEPSLWLCALSFSVLFWYIYSCKQAKTGHKFNSMTVELRAMQHSCCKLFLRFFLSLSFFLIAFARDSAKNPWGRFFIWLRNGFEGSVLLHPPVASPTLPSSQLRQLLPFDVSLATCSLCIHSATWEYILGVINFGVSDRVKVQELPGQWKLM